MDTASMMLNVTQNSMNTRKPFSAYDLSLFHVIFINCILLPFLFLAKVKEYIKKNKVVIQYGEIML